MIDHHTALIYVMVLVSAADREMTDAEMQTIDRIVNYLPVFRDYDEERLPQDAATCAELMGAEEGLDTAMQMVKKALPEKLRETAYAVACDVAASDGKISQETLQLLELIRHEVGVGRLPAAAIERGARARHMVL
jgi:tellurite resistance protein